MNKTGFIYSNIHYYRLVMSLLYKGNYYGRFQPACKLITGKTVTEICFGDTVIARYCKKNGIAWTGIDINPAFVKVAVQKGFTALECDVENETFPKAETSIICGSLYHFHENLQSLISKMLDCAPEVIISEPVVNLSNNKGIIGKLAKASAHVNGKAQPFRYTKTTLIKALDELTEKLNFRYEIKEEFDKDIILVLKR